MGGEGVAAGSVVFLRSIRWPPNRCNMREGLRKNVIMNKGGLRAPSTLPAVTRSVCR